MLFLAAALLFSPAPASAQFSFSFFGNSDDEDSDSSDATDGDVTTVVPGAFGNDVALVESIENAPDAGVAFMDSLQPERTIDLGAGGVLVLSYFESCRRETIRGGRVTVGRESSGVAGGAVRSETFDCRGATPIITAEVGEAGAAVKRVTPFDPEDWREWTVKARRPIFKWQPESAGELATVSVVYLDSPRLKLVWQGATTEAHVIYPDIAPSLEIGMPYLVQIDRTGVAPVSAVFSVDPWLDLADNAANRLVPIYR
jgi:hypothetical protein